MGNGKEMTGMCMKWPWEEGQHGCKWEMPWPFKILDLFIRQINHKQQEAGGQLPLPLTTNGNAWQRRGRGRGRGDADTEERALASALASRKEATLIQFYSRRCRLCNSLAGVVREVEARNKGWLNIVMADVETKTWLPEVLHYDINYVPCFVLLDTCGTALAKTGTPASRLHVLTGLSYLLESMRPIKKAVRHESSSPVNDGTEFR